MERSWMELTNHKNQVREIMKTNEYTAKYGLTLTGQDAELLAKERINALKEQKRVEFGQGIMQKLIFEFCDSAYISQSSYREILVKLQDIFYLFKNEMMDEITDDELIHFMREQFETVCFGDLDYLAGTVLENFAQAIRAGYGNYAASDGYGAYEAIDPVTRWDYELFWQTLSELF